MIDFLKFVFVVVYIVTIEVYDRIFNADKVVRRRKRITD
jgi:hypothetical protein